MLCVYCWLTVHKRITMVEINCRSVIIDLSLLSMLINIIRVVIIICTIIINSISIIITIIINKHCDQYYYYHYTVGILALIQN